MVKVARGVHPYFKDTAHCVEFCWKGVLNLFTKMTMWGKTYLLEQAVCTPDFYWLWEILLFFSKWKSAQSWRPGWNGAYWKKKASNSEKEKIFYMCLRYFLQRGKSAFLFVRVKPYEFFSLYCRITKRAPINNDKSKLSSLEGLFFLCMDHQDGTFQAQFLSSCRGWNWNFFSQLQSCRWDIRLSLYGLKEAACHWACYRFFFSKLKSTSFLRATERT